MLFKVYDPKGECFEVTPGKARVLVIEAGWSLNAPAQAEFVLEAPVEEPAAVVVDEEPTSGKRSKA